MSFALTINFSVPATAAGAENIEIDVHLIPELDENFDLEKNNEQLLSLANYTLSWLKDDYTFDVTAISNNLFEAIIQYPSSGFEETSSHQFTIIVENNGNPLRVLNNFSAGKVGSEVKQTIINALQKGKYPVADEREIRSFQAILLLQSDAEYKEIRRDSNALNRIRQRLRRAIRDNKKEAVESAYADLQKANYGNLTQYVGILTSVFEYQMFINAPIPALIDSLDAILTTNYNLLRPVTGYVYARRQQQIENIPKIAFFANRTNRAEKYLAIGASLSSVESIIMLRREYWRYLIQNQRFLEAKIIWDHMAIYEESEFLVEASAIAARIEIILATKEHRLVADIIDADGLASLDFDGDKISLRLEEGEISKAEIFCSNHYEQLTVENTIEIPARPELGRCRVYVTGAVGSTYAASYN